MWAKTDSQQLLQEILTAKKLLDEHKVAHGYPTASLIEAAEEYADKYLEDDRQDIRTDVLNAFYAGFQTGVFILTKRIYEDTL